jgi:hypothetical protein
MREWQTIKRHSYRVVAEFTPDQRTALRQAAKQKGRSVVSELRRLVDREFNLLEGYKQ